MADQHEIEQGIVGEVPGGDTFAGQLSESIIRGFVNSVRTMRKRKAPEGHELAVIIPSDQGRINDIVPLDELTLSRDPENHGFIATFKKSVKDELGEHATRDVVVGLTVTAAVVVAGSLYWRHKK